MAVVLTPELLALLDDPRPLHTGVLVTFSLPGGGEHRITDYYKDVILDGDLYTSGPLSSIGDIKQTAAFSTYTLQVQVTGADSLEMNRVLNSGAYMGKKITVHRIYINSNGDIVPSTATSIGLPMFEGVITQASIADSSATSSQAGSSIITWSCSSKFADFQVVNGRSTNDAEHRGLVLAADGVTLIPSDAARKPEYKTDKGFLYAESTTAILANYQITETKQKIETTKGGYLWR